MLDGRLRDATASTAPQHGSARSSPGRKLWNFEHARARDLAGTPCERRAPDRRGAARSTRRAVIEEIQDKALLGRYRIRGFGTLRERPLPSLDDLTFLPASLTRIPLEGYRERCETTTVLGHPLRRAADRRSTSR